MNEEINQHIEQIEQSLAAIKMIMQSQGDKSFKRLPMAESIPAYQLSETPDYKQDAWPEAVKSHLIVKNDDDQSKIFRALQIITVTGLSFDGKQVLDCGCEEGFITNEISKVAHNVVGYDIVENPKWRDFTNSKTIFTSEKTVVERLKYDIIVLYDVIDHLEKENPVHFMQWLKSLLNPSGIIYVRTHPWTSIHGGHLYETVNKAYLHLAMTTEELVREKFIVPHNLKFSRPISAYESIFEQVGFIKTRKSYTNEVDDFVIEKLLDRIIQITWKGNIDRDIAIKILATQFIDYFLTIE